MTACAALGRIHLVRVCRKIAGTGEKRGAKPPGGAERCQMREVPIVADPDMIPDAADMVGPCPLAPGIEMVFANGSRTWKDDASTGTTPDRA